MSSHYQRLQEDLRDRPRRWVVTGAAGFIGSNLVETLLRMGQTVTAIDNYSTGSVLNLHDALMRAGNEKLLRVLELDIRDPLMAEACKGADYVLHQAALGSVPASIDDPEYCNSVNVDGFLNTIKAARVCGVSRFVYASSSAVYGDLTAARQREPNIGQPLSPYAVSKRVNELYARVFEECYGIETVGLRYFNVFGRRQDPNGAYAAVIPCWVAALLSSQPCRIFGDGENSRDFCHVDNVVQANLLAATAGLEAPAGVYNVACGKSTSLNQLYELLRAGIARCAPRVADARPIYDPPRPGDIRHSMAEIELAEERLGYRPQVDVLAGLEETLDWYVENFTAARTDTAA